MSTGKAYVAAFYVTCPHCEESLTDPKTGSFLIGRDSVDAFRRDGHLTSDGVVTCIGCVEPYRLPAAVLRLSPL